MVNLKNGLVMSFLEKHSVRGCLNKVKGVRIIKLMQV